jgi:hypothetical protein
MVPRRLKLFAVSISEGIHRLLNGCPPSSPHRFGRSPGGSVLRGHPIGVPYCPNKEIRLILAVASGAGDAGRTGEMHLPVEDFTSGSRVAVSQCAGSSAAIHA